VSLSLYNNIKDDIIEIEIDV
jgi:hypothetical protein